MLGEVALVPADVDVVALRPELRLPEDRGGRLPAGPDAPARALAVDGPDRDRLRAERGVERLDELPVADGVGEGDEERGRAGDPFDRAARAPERDLVPLDRGVEDPHGHPHPPSASVRWAGRARRGAAPGAAARGGGTAP